jgi:hypothetical protein
MIPANARLVADCSVPVPERLSVRRPAVAEVRLSVRRPAVLWEP